MGKYTNPLYLSGTRANRPAPGVQGRTYYQTDTGDVLTDEGYRWNANPSKNGLFSIQATGPLGLPVDVQRDFGAVGDGVTDDTEALISAFSNGGVIYLPPGTYLVASPLIVPNNTMIYGAGRGLSTIQAADSFVGSSVVMSVGDVSNLTIRDMSIDANNQSTEGIKCPYISAGTTDVTIRSCSVYNTGGSNNNGIDVVEVSARVNILECYLAGCSGPGVQISEPTDCQVSGCTFSGNMLSASGGLGVYGDISISYTWLRMAVTDCIFYNSGIHNSGASFILAALSGGPGLAQSLVITGCMGDTCGGHGILVMADAAAGDVIFDTTISGCVVHNAGAANAAGDGVYLWSDAGTITNAEVVGCSSYHSAGYGYEVQGVGIALADCVAYGSADPGFWISCSGFSISGCSSTNSSGALGYDLHNCVDGVVSGCAAVGNDWGGIRLANCQRVGVIGCTANGNGVGSTAGASTQENSGIVLEATCAHCTISGNTTMNQSRVSGSTNITAGIRLYGATYCLVEGNLCSDDQSTLTQQYGIYEDNGGNFNTIRNNDVRGNLSGPLAGVGADTIVEQNVGYNPVGALSIAVPASGTAVAACGYARTFYVTAASGGCTMQLEGGPSILIPASGLGAVRVPAGAAVTPTYTTAPSWVVEGE
ncbi:glycosyl hydrolase family 28-related protein [Thiomonas sp.]